jgi:hypothetical protein
MAGADRDQRLRQTLGAQRLEVLAWRVDFDAIGSPQSLGRLRAIASLSD